MQATDTVCWMPFHSFEMFTMLSRISYQYPLLFKAAKVIALKSLTIESINQSTNSRCFALFSLFCILYNYVLKSCYWCGEKKYWVASLAGAPRLISGFECLFAVSLQLFHDINFPYEENDDDDDNV